MAIGALMCPTWAIAQCPDGFIDCNGVRTESSDATLASSCVGAEASYDIAVGRLEMRAQTNTNVIVDFVDRFVLSGISDTSPVPLRIDLELTGFLEAPAVHIGAGAFIILSYSQGESDAVLHAAFDSHSLAYRIDDVLQLDAIVLPNEPFLLTCNVAVYGHDRTGDVVGRIVFRDLPPEAQVTSCKGFHQTAVSVHSTTWGRVKALY